MQGDADVIVVGAGVAGLAAALNLTQAGLKVVILEARDRIGGRIFTNRDSVANAPVELGAEFIHGRPPEILQPLRELNIEPVATSGEDWCEKDGQLTQCDLFSDVDELLEKMDDRGPDESFLDFIQRCCPDIGSETRERALSYVTGFHAADPALISVHSLVRGLRADEKIDGERAFRIPRGYATLIEYYCQRLDGVPIHRNTIVQQVRWGAGQVVLDGHNDDGHKTYSAPRAVLTLPLGVLQAPFGEPGALHFSPELPTVKQKALSSLAMGKVLRVTLRFRERFWEELKPAGSKTLADMRFLFSRQPWFPTWWTTMPDRLPIITGWAPSHCAGELSGKSAALVFSSAWETLKTLFQMAGRNRFSRTKAGPPRLDEQQIEDLVESAAFHDWQSDPFCRGAYSYVRVRGDSAQADLAAPLENALFFAGEATDVSGYHGTVHGAIASGHRAAHEILER